MTILVRVARPEDASQVVPLMHESSRDLIDYSFRFPDEDPTSFLERDFLRGRGLFGYENQVVAVDGDRVVGTMTFYAGRRATELTLRTLGTAVRHYRWRNVLACIGRSIAIAPLFIKPRSDGTFLANACVVGSHRGRGVFSRLLAGAVEVTRPRVIELDVSFSNASAQKIYEHLGFRTTGERPYRGSKKLDGFRRMELTVSG